MMLTRSRVRSSPNLLFAALTERDEAALLPHARTVSLPRGSELTRPDEPIACAYFIENGVVSVIKPGGRNAGTEICIIGAEGFCGGPIITADCRWPYLSLVQVEELRALAVPAEVLAAAAEQSAPLRTMLVRAMHIQMIQIAEGLVSAAWQRLPGRLARWLLMYRDRMRSDRLHITHGFIALMVGAQRTGITAALHELEGDGLIAAGRGVIVIRDATALERLADGSYGVAEREAKRLVGAARQPA